MTGRFPALADYLLSCVTAKSETVASSIGSITPTVARLLHDAGYATGHFGKWHMGGQRDVGDAPLITEYGFDKSVTQFEGLGDRILPLCDKFDGQPPQRYALGSDKLGHGEITWMDRSKVTSGFVERALQFIRQAEHDDKPFYVDVWPDDVHSPFFPPKALRGNHKNNFISELSARWGQLAPLFNFIRQEPNLHEYAGHHRQ
jgi:uncharacterized sulfatase